MGTVGYSSSLLTQGVPMGACTILVGVKCQLQSKILSILGSRRGLVSYLAIFWWRTAWFLNDDNIKWSFSLIEIFIPYIFSHYHQVLFHLYIMPYHYTLYYNLLYIISSSLYLSSTYILSFAIIIFILDSNL